MVNIQHLNLNDTTKLGKVVNFHKAQKVSFPKRI